MTMLMMTTLSMMTSLLFPKMLHPLSMGLALIIQTMLVAMITGLMINMFWFSYILIMTMLSGALVLFIYMASVASNEKFHPSVSMLMITLLPLMMLLLTTNPSLTDQMSKTKIWSVSSKISIMNEQVVILTKLFSSHMFMTLLMVNYLLFTMICISYIVGTQEGPLRMKS